MRSGRHQRARTVIDRAHTEYPAIEMVADDDGLVLQMGVGSSRPSSKALIRDALRGRLSVLEVARPMSTVKPRGREILRDLTTDSFVGPGDQGDGFVLHSNLFFASSSHQFLIEFLKSRIILTINSNPHAGSH